MTKESRPHNRCLALAGATFTLTYAKATESNTLQLFVYLGRKLIQRASVTKQDIHFCPGNASLSYIKTINLSTKTPYLYLFSNLNRKQVLCPLQWARICFPCLSDYSLCIGCMGVNS